MRTCRIALILLVGALWIAVPTASNAATDSPARLSVVSVASDVHAFVLRDASGQLLRHAEGALLTPDWRVARVAADTVTLEYTHALAGQSAQLTLRAGDDVDLGEQAQRLASLRGTRQTPARIRVVPNKPQPASRRTVPKT